jgi:hypothetical protein
MHNISICAFDHNQDHKMIASLTKSIIASRLKHVGNSVTWQVLAHGVPFIENFSNTSNHKENQKDEHVMAK